MMEFVPRAMPTMLTIKETAERAGMSEWFIRRLVWEKKIVFINTGKKYYINWEKFVAYLNTGDGVPESEENREGYGVIRRQPERIDLLDIQTGAERNANNG